MKTTERTGAYNSAIVAIVSSMKIKEEELTNSAFKRRAQSAMRGYRSIGDKANFAFWRAELFLVKQAMRGAA